MRWLALPGLLVEGLVLKYLQFFDIVAVALPNPPLRQPPS
jgi:hypothetical protein